MAKQQEPSTIVKIFNLILIIITIFAVGVISMLVYFSYWGKDKVPTALTTAYVTSITDPQTKEEKTVMEVKVMSNEINNGEPMVEFLINSYTDTSRSALIGIGFQLVGDDLYYYNRTNSGSFMQVTDFNQKEDVFLIDIEDQLIALRLDGTYEVEQIDGWKIVRTIGFLGLNTLFEGDNYVKTVSHNYTIKDFMEAIRDTVVSNSNGTGEGTLSLVDVSAYFNLYDATTNEQIKNESLGQYGLQRSYFNVEYSYSKAGVNWAKQSLFGSVAGDGDYNNSTIDPNKDYWQATSRVELTFDNFEKRTSALDGKDYLYLTPETISKMNLNTAIEIYININLDGTNVGGFDYYALSNLKNIKEIKITSSVEKSFKILNDALLKTGINSGDIVTTNVTIESEVENEIKVV